MSIQTFEMVSMGLEYLDVQTDFLMLTHLKAVAVDNHFSLCVQQIEYMMKSTVLN
jgi:hypothetical protein